MRLYDDLTRLCRTCGDPFRFRAYPWLLEHRWFCSNPCARRSSGSSLRKLPAGDTVPRLYAMSGLSMREIGQRYGVTVTSVRKVLLRSGVKPRFRTLRQTCIETGCGRPIARTFDKRFQCRYGRRCLFHRRARLAEYRRNRYRAINSIPPERWRLNNLGVR